MALVSMGVYVFKKELLVESLGHFCETGRGYDFGRDLIPSLIRSNRTYAYDFRDEVHNSPRYWRDIGTVDGYYEASMDVVQPDAPFDPYANEACPLQPTRHPASIGHCVTRPSSRRDDDSCVVRTVLAPDVELEDGVMVEDSVLMPGVRIAKGARLRRAIVEEGVHIPAGFQVGFDVDEDRKLHTVTDSGVVVVSRTPTETKPIVLHFRFEKSGSEPKRLSMAMQCVPPRNQSRPGGNL